jgi:Aromatic acid exporter family member 1
VSLRYRVRRRGRSAFFRAARLTGASVAAYLVAEAVGLDDPPPLVAALTALLVVQATASSTLSSGVERLLSVVAGVALAIAFSALVGLTWWSLAILVAASIVVGQLLRLGPNLIEVPISAMLVLGVGYAAGAQELGLSRVIETLLGAAVGVLVNVVFPPAVRSRYAGQAVQRLAEEIAALLDEAAEGMGGGPAGPAGRATDSGNFFPTGTGWFSIPSIDRSSGDRGLTPEATRRWLDDARRLNRHIPRVDRALIHAEESRRLNVRALGTPESSRSLRGGLEALEVCSVAVRTVFRALDDWVRQGVGGAATADVVATRTACAELMVDLAAVVRAFGAVLRAEVEGAATAEQADLTNALDRLRGERDRYAEVLYADPREHPDLWELTGSLLVLIDRMLLELDSAAHARLWEDRRRAALDRCRAAHLVHRLRPPRRPGERPQDDAPGSGGRAGPADAPGTAPPAGAPEQRSPPPTRGPRRREDTP